MLAPRLRLEYMFSKLTLKQTCNTGEHKQQTTTPSYHDGCVADGNVTNSFKAEPNLKEKRPFIHTTLRWLGDYVSETARFDNKRDIKNHLQLAKRCLY